MSPELLGIIIFYHVTITKHVQCGYMTTYKLQGRKLALKTHTLYDKGKSQLFLADREKYVRVKIYF